MSPQTDPDFIEALRPATVAKVLGDASLHIERGEGSQALELINLLRHEFEIDDALLHRRHLRYEGGPACVQN